MAQVGRFRSPEGVCYQRGTRVVLRTVRGLEVGQVVCEDPTPAAEPDGALLRGMTAADELLAVRLEQNRERAYGACVALLQERGHAAVLIDVEHLFDGSGLYFYFLGPTTPEIEALTSELAATYDAEARFQQFADAVTTGCGPGCGTEEKACGGSGGCDTCATCAVASACSTQRSAPPQESNA